MGNQISNPEKKTDEELKPKSISQIMDYIATYYILTMDFKSLKKLYEKEYCDKLVVLTSDIIERYFTNIEITYLAQRIKEGVEVNEIDKDKLIFFDKDDLNKLDIQNSIKKKRICISISKFYVKIAHLFAAIVTTINPTYIYKDTEGNTVRANLFEKNKIPPNTPRSIYKMNICDNRINDLKNNNGPELNNDEISINPKNICSSSINDKGENKNLEEEPGIPELIELYYDDNYNFETGKFTGMTNETKNIFEQDLKIFYNVFTGKDEFEKDKGPPKKFSDIKIKDYHSDKNCLGSEPLFEKKVVGSKSDNLFAAYADNLKQMINKANRNQEYLLTILNKLFAYTINPQTNKKQIRVSPTLTEAGLQNLVLETRALIINLYLTCQVEYSKGIKIYEAIIEKKILETMSKQQKTLSNIESVLLAEEKIPVPAEVAVIQNDATKKIENEKQDMELKLKEQQLVTNPKEVLTNTNKTIPV